VRYEAGVKCRSSSNNFFTKESLVTEFFTRETWRAGNRSKLRKRKHCYAGCKVAPPAFLAAAKIAAFKPGRPGYRLCNATKRDGNPCRRLAMKELKVCEAHGGVLALARQGKLQSSGRTAAFKADRAAMIEGRSPPAPLELTRLQVYRGANDWTRMRMVRAWGTPGWLPLVRQIQRQDI
jgi:hypothetical protein